MHVYADNLPNFLHVTGSMMRLQKGHQTHATNIVIMVGVDDPSL